MGIGQLGVASKWVDSEPIRRKGSPHLSPLPFHPQVFPDVSDK